MEKLNKKWVIVSSIVGITVAYAFYGDYTNNRNLQAKIRYVVYEAEIPAYKYRFVEDFAKKYPEMKSSIKEAMVDGYISEEEFDKLNALSLSIWSREQGAEDKVKAKIELVKRLAD